MQNHALIGEQQRLVDSISLIWFKEKNCHVYNTYRVCICIDLQYLLLPFKLVNTNLQMS